MKIKCPRCDFENEKRARFCKNCNDPLSKQSYSEENPYIKKREIDRETIKSILFFLVIAAVLFFGAFRGTDCSYVGHLFLLVVGRLYFSDSARDISYIMDIF